MKALYLLVFLSTSATASDLPDLRTFAQSEFRKLSEDLGAAAAYKGVTPAGGLGPLGFDVGVEVTRTKTERADLVIPKVHISKGLPFGFDIGGFVGGVPEYSAGLFGADLKWTVLDDGLTRPAIALRASATATNGLDPVDVKTAALDVMVSKKLALVTPYAGAGTVRIVSKASGVGLAEEKFGKSRVFAGVNLNLTLVNMAVEMEKLGGVSSLSAKLGWRF